MDQSVGELDNFIKSLTLGDKNAEAASSKEFHDEINADYMAEWKKSLLFTKPTLKDKAAFHFNFKPTLELIGKICINLKLTVETEFAAYDCLIFMLENFLDQLNDAIEDETAGDVETVEACWRQVYVVFKQDVTLIIFLIISITSKVYSQVKVLKAEQLHALMVHCGQDIALKDLVKRELQLMKTMNMSVPEPKALLAVEPLLRNVLKGMNALARLGPLNKLAITLLRLTYLDSYAIYGRVVADLNDNKLIRRLMEDKALLAASVVYLTCNICYVRSPMVLRIILATIGNECKRNVHDILKMSQAIHVSYEE